MTREEAKERFRRITEPEWVRKMKEHYAKTGTYRPKDLRRLLGDPATRVEVGADRSMPRYLSCH